MSVEITGTKHPKQVKVDGKKVDWTRAAQLEQELRERAVAEDKPELDDEANKIQAAREDALNKGVNLWP